MPVEVNIVVNTAVPPAKVVAVDPAGVTLTALPIGVLPSENVTVPVAPTALPLDEEIVAVSVIGVPEATVDTLGTVAVEVAAFDTIRLSVTGVVTAL